MTASWYVLSVSCQGPGNLDDILGRKIWLASIVVHLWNMMTSSNGNIFRVTGPLCGKFTGPGEFPTQRPVTRSFDVFFDLGLNKRLNKHSWGWWFETLSWSLWRHHNDKSDIFRHTQGHHPIQCTAIILLGIWQPERGFLKTEFLSHAAAVQINMSNISEYIA